MLAVKSAVQTVVCFTAAPHHLQHRPPSTAGSMYNLGWHSLCKLSNKPSFNTRGAVLGACGELGGGMPEVMTY